MNRFVTFVRGILVGQIHSKMLRLSATNARDRSPATLIEVGINEATASIPDLLGVGGNVLELVIALFNLSRIIGAIALITVIPALCRFVRSKLLKHKYS